MDVILYALHNIFERLIPLLYNNVWFGVDVNNILMQVDISLNTSIKQKPSWRSLINPRKLTIPVSSTAGV